MNDGNKPDLDASYDAGSAEENRRVYRDWAESYDDEFAARTGYRFGEVIAGAFVAAGGTGPLLDAGCGTGLVADHLPRSVIVDGVDFSPEMLAVAARKGRYRALLEADLTKPLPLEDGAYAGLTSAGTFTQGHVGPEALPELLRTLRAGAVAAISGKRPFFEDAGFPEMFAALIGKGLITPPQKREERVYRPGAAAPEGHEDDTAYIITFQKR